VVRASCFRHGQYPKLGLDADPLMLHLCAALTGKERALISSRTKAAQPGKAQGVEARQPARRPRAAKGHAAHRVSADRFRRERLADRGEHLG
jgi:hypothetical protein